jgi:hypothetical protein
MTNVMPEGEDIRQAVKWVSACRGDYPEKNLKKLIEEACLKFDLSPQKADFLLNFFCKKEETAGC